MKINEHHIPDKVPYERYILFLFTVQMNIFNALQHSICANTNDKRNIHIYGATTCPILEYLHFLVLTFFTKHCIGDLQLSSRILNAAYICCTNFF